MCASTCVTLTSHLELQKKNNLDCPDSITFVPTVNKCGASVRSFSLRGLSFFLSSPFHVSLPIFSNVVLLPKSLGALTDGSVENPAMHPNPTVGRPPGQRGRKPGRRKTKVSSPWSQKSSVLGAQSIQAGKGLEPKVPKKRGPKPGSKVGVMWFRGIRDRCLCPLTKNRAACANCFISPA